VPELSTNAMPETRVITDEELLQLPKDGNKYEVVDGELRMSPAGWLHERIVGRLLIRLGSFVEERRLGDVLPSNALFVLPSGNRRGPDISFLVAGRLAAVPPEKPFPALAPDLVVEVLSPGDSTRAILDKVGEYLQGGVRLVWVIDPRTREAAVHRSLTDVEVVREDGTLDGGGVVPGFRVPLADLLK
jgi:Uma2 family endonuclease